MSFVFLNRPNIEKSENLFDIFLLLYIYCKEEEGNILHGYSQDYETFDSFQKDIEKFLTKNMEQSAGLQVNGLIEDEGIKEYFAEGIGGTNKNEFILASLLAIDRLYKQPDSMTTPVLNRNFREYGEVYFVNKRAFGFERFYWMIRGLDTIGDRMENKLTNITAIAKIATDYTVRFVELPSLVDHLFEKDSIRVAIVPFRNEDDPPARNTTWKKDKELYFCVKPAKDSKCLARLERVISELEKRNVDIIIFPELTFSEDLLVHLKLVLAEKYRANGNDPAIKLVVTGSFHAEGKNKCFVLRPDGKSIFCQTKMNRFLFLPGEYKGTNEKVTEDIDISERVFNLFDCRFGRVATMICLDFLVPETYNILSGLKVNCFFLPSMTPSTKRFETNAFYHACASGAVTFFSNAYNLEIASEQKKRDSFIFRPIHSRKDGSEKDPKKEDVTKKYPKKEDDPHIRYLERAKGAFETVLLFDSKNCEVQSVTLS